MATIAQLRLINVRGRGGMGEQGGKLVPKEVNKERKVSGNSNIMLWEGTFNT